MLARKMRDACNCSATQIEPRPPAITTKSLLDRRKRCTKANVHHAAVPAARTIAQGTLVDQEDACTALGRPSCRGESGIPTAHDEPVDLRREWRACWRRELRRVRCVVMPGDGVCWLTCCA